MKLGLAKVKFAFGHRQCDVFADGGPHGLDREGGAHAAGTGNTLNHFLGIEGQRRLGVAGGCDLYGYVFG